VRIVLSHLRLTQAGGTETYMVTVAEQLQRLGHQPVIYAPETGPMADQAVRRGIDVVDRVRLLPDECDGVLAQDAPTAYELADRYPETGRAFVAHSSEALLQSPPSLAGVCGAVVVLNDRVKRYVETIPGVPEVLRLRQPIDTARFGRTPGVEPPRGRPRALVLSNYMRGPRRRMIERACARSGVELVEVGLTSTPTEAPEHVIARCHLVIAIGRSALEGMAGGRPTYVYGAAGGDGWVTGASYPAIEADGFGGRGTELMVTEQRLAEDLVSWTEDMGVVCRDLVAQHHTASSHVRDLLGLLARLKGVDTPTGGQHEELARLVRLAWTEHERAAAGRTELFHLGEVLDRAQAVAEERQARIEELESELELSRERQASLPWKSPTLWRYVDVVRGLRAELSRRDDPSQKAAIAVDALLHFGSVGMRRLTGRPLSSLEGPGVFELKVAAVRAFRLSQRARGDRIEPSDPGTRLLGLEPAAVSRLGSRLGSGSVLISGTNGKTTTAAMAAEIFARDGLVPVHNKIGINMANGVATSLLAAARVAGRIRGDIGVFEVDEFWLERLIADLHPHAIGLGNLFRDQLDRYGELDAVADRWERLVAGLAPSCTIAACADDPLLVSLASGHARTLYFGLDDDTVGRTTMQHASDSKHRRICGQPYLYDRIWLAHLGRYCCPTCGIKRPIPDVTARSLRRTPSGGTRFTLASGDEKTDVHLALPGLFNVYNALHAATLAVAMGTAMPAIVEGLQAVRPVFGRTEVISTGRVTLQLFLVKNPAGANAVLETLDASTSGPGDVVLGLNDSVVDGRDVSWIWDVDFETIAPSVRRAICTGSRADELALRLKYAGVDEAGIQIEPDVANALDAVPAQAGIVPAIFNYTAMLELREILADRRLAPRYWA
jgi:lipid II isoglutaminyl synthase (glutamine-hydrolysing)